MSVPMALQRYCLLSLQTGALGLQTRVGVGWLGAEVGDSLQEALIEDSVRQPQLQLLK